ncbi:MAG: succinylglutamate desuccinylase/aspartoacylase family protein [Phycisphaeraceae bacterium]|nr:succinylglutamate desuccinylase/aspartoacylase family protein [Phycisphaeraceae bacterium]
MNPRCIGQWNAPRPGALLIVTAALHGNEPAGVLAARKVIDRLNAAPPADARGRVVALLGNVAASNRSPEPVRYLDRDLNRSFTPELLRAARALPEPERDAEQREALELLAAIEHHARSAAGPVFLLDLHTVSAPSAPFAFVEDSLPARAFAMSLGVPVFLGFEEELSGLLVDHATSEHHLVSALFEAGLHDDPASVDLHAGAIERAMLHASITPAGASPPTPRPRFYDVRHRFAVTDDTLEVHPDIEPLARVRRGQIVATERGVPLRSPMRGLAFMPNRQPVKRPGDDALFIVVPVGRAWMWLSRVIRTREFVHRWLPRLAPGVHRDRHTPSLLHVDEHIAVALKREVFHLLGYRIVTGTPDPHLPWRRRCLAAARALLASIPRALGRRHANAGLAADSRYTPHWSVARRTLDLPDPAPRRGPPPPGRHPDRDPVSRTPEEASPAGTTACLSEQ